MIERQKYPAKYDYAYKKSRKMKGEGAWRIAERGKYQTREPGS